MRLLFAQQGPVLMTVAKVLNISLTDVLDHVASQITQHERGRFWLREIFERSSPSSKRALVRIFLWLPLQTRRSS